MKFRPVGERALVKPVVQEMTASGIVLPHAPRKKPRSARVVAVGRFENGARVDEGDVVGFANWIPDSDDLLGVVEEEGRFLAWRTRSQGSTPTRAGPSKRA
jgi:co-chaperonin GroES (HSP10)